MITLQREPLSSIIYAHLLYYNLFGLGLKMGDSFIWALNAHVEIKETGYTHLSLFHEFVRKVQLSEAPTLPVRMLLSLCVPSPPTPHLLNASHVSVGRPLLSTDIRPASMM